MTSIHLSQAVQDLSRRHIIPLSGGKDSTALAVYMLEHYSSLPLEFVFTDTGAELPETYSYLRRFEAIFGIKIIRMSALDLPELRVRSKNGRRSPFDVFLNEVYSGFLPSPQIRWCTRMLKIKPFEHFINNENAYSYIGIRADENREGFRSTTTKSDYKNSKTYNKTEGKTERGKPVVFSHLGNILPVYPLKDIGFGLRDVNNLLINSGLGLPTYYQWRSRSGCYFCFYQQIGEWQGLKIHHPDLFEAAKAYEITKPNGRKFTWSQHRSLEELEKIHKRYTLSTNEAQNGCAICHL